MAGTIDLVYDSVVYRTQKATLFKFGSSEHWVPNSVIHDDPDTLNDGGGEVVVALWFVEKEGLEVYAL